jgi:Ca2+-binding RTX toxin-like protein
MSTYNVTSTSGLNAALKSAHAGDTIALGAGTYTGVNVANINIAGKLTITSSDASHPAILAGLKVGMSSGINFSNLEMTTVGSGDAYFGFRMGYSSNITFSNVDMHGSVDGKADNDITGLLIQHSSNITIENSNIHDLKAGVIIDDDKYVQVVGNKFYDIRVDAIESTSTSHLTVSKNSFTDFRPVGVGGSADHPDAVQIWATGKVIQKDIDISDNVMTRGSGEVFQGVFIGGSDVAPLQDVVVKGNTLVGTMYNGIAVGQADNVVVQGNTVAGTDMTSWIRVQNVTSGAVSGNSITNLITIGNSKDLVIGANSTIKAASDGGSTLVGKYLTSHADVASYVMPTFRGMAVAVGGTSTASSGGGQTLTGTAGVDHLVGLGGADRIDGGKGDDVLTGGLGVDTFVFRPGSGHDVISDFGSHGEHDVLDLSALYAAGGKAAISMVGSDTLIKFSSGDDVTLLGVQSTSLHSTSTGFFI